MAKEFTLRGVPASILNDSWWLTGPTGEGGAGGARTPPSTQVDPVGPLGGGPGWGGCWV